jgi:PTS system cellobiose-specific IIB component
MARKEILLICSAGMSTSMLVAKMQKIADAKNIDVDIYAVSVSEVDNMLTHHSISVVLLGPQIRYLEEKFSKEFEPMNIPMGIISMKDYGLMDGEKILSQGVSLLR